MEVVTSVMSSEFGNASSKDHVFGDRAAHLVEQARAEIADLVEARRAKIVFTSGATEAINLVINHVSSSSSAR
ncbi:aminotransferase class V-fold PLP-dependent enzyme, partial [Acinetobacter baumannii]